MLTWEHDTSNCGCQRRLLARYWLCSSHEEVPPYYGVYLKFKYLTNIRFADIFHLSEFQLSPCPPHLTSYSPHQLDAQLQAARKAQGLTQAALAARVGLSQSRVSHLEQHAQELSVEQLLAWCAVLGLELSLGQRGGAADLPATDWWGS